MSDYEIFPYDGYRPTQLTNDGYRDERHPVYGFNVVWYSDKEIFLVQISGDFNEDGDVDAFDFADWQANYPMASGATLAMGDSNGDGDVDAFDFADWQANYPYPPGAEPTPEPTTLGLLALGSLALLRRKR